MNFTGFTYGNPAGDGQVAAWRLNGAYTFTFLDNGLAQVVSEIPGQVRVSPGPRRSRWLAGSRRSTACRPTPTEATLFAVDVDQTLNVLTKDPATGWTQTSCTKTAPPAAGHLMAGADQHAGRQRRRRGRRHGADGRGPAGRAVAGSGSTILTPGSPVTMTADGSGPSSPVSRRRSWTPRCSPRRPWTITANPPAACSRSPRTSMCRTSWPGRTR